MESDGVAADATLVVRAAAPPAANLMKSRLPERNLFDIPLSFLSVQLTRPILYRDADCGGDLFAEEADGAGEVLVVEAGYGHLK